MSLPVVLFDDLELWATGALRTALAARSEPYTDNVYVSNDIPFNTTTGEPERRPRMVTIRRDGGPRAEVAPLETARIGVNVYAETDQDANDLARMVSALLWSFPDGDPVTKVNQILGPSVIDDPSRQPRRYMTFEFTARGTDA
jgi:hypothetical protein